MPTSLWLDVLRRDLKFTRRVLTKNLAFTTTAIVTLALGIAASTVIYTVVDAVLLQPLDYNDSGDIYRVYTVDTLGLPRGTTGGPHMHPVAEEGELIQAAIYGYSFEQSVVNDEGTPFAVSEFRTSDEFFDVFTEPLLMGREFEPREDYRNTILSYQTWRDVYSSDPNILGKPINVGSGPLTVIGVAAQGFEFPVGTAMWTKIFTLPEGQPLPLLNLSGYVRVQPGVSAAQAQAELDVFAGRLAPWPDGRKVELVARPLLEDVVGDLRPTLFIVSGATAVLLLIACINVANLLLARGVVRASEFALREASGAGRRDDARWSGPLEIIPTKADYVLDLIRMNSLWPLLSGLACCAIEMMSAATSKNDMDRWGMFPFRASPRQADVLIVAGTLTTKMAGPLVRLWEQMPEPKWCVAMGDCTCSGGRYKRSYSTVEGIDRVMPVDVYVPGCPPRPEGLIFGMMKLQQLIKDRRGHWPERPIGPTVPAQV